MIQYSRKQIENAIKYWQLILESSSILLDNLANDLGRDNVFNVTKKISIDDALARKIYYSLNKYFFYDKLDFIPINYLSTNDFKNVLISRNSPAPLNNDFLGVHSVLYDEDSNKITLNTKINFHDSILMFHKNKLDNKSFIFNIASICHEMIHYYDLKFGDFEYMARKMFVERTFKDFHQTQTFQYMLKKANSENLKVLQTMYTTDVNQLDFDAILDLFNSIYENESIDTKNTEQNKEIKIIPGIAYPTRRKTGGGTLTIFD